ncbi:hypothetical protein MMC17_004851 [Xylographa soralifera]|nr:hypothetical protein [Xylographa soralifera]
MSPATERISDIFIRKWRQEWRCYPPGDDRLAFFRFYSMKQWMIQREANQPKTNGEQLLAEVEPVKPNFSEEESIFPDYALVFCILQSEGYGNLILHFQALGISDEHIQNRNFTVGELTKSLKRLRVQNVDALLQNFDLCRKQLFPVTLRYRKTETWDRHDVLPFRKFRLVKEGGQASVFDVSVPAEFVSDDMRRALGQSTECYTLALKSYSESQNETYEDEGTAFEGLKDVEGVVRYFGRFIHPHTWGRAFFKYHKMLELGQSNLLEHFRHEQPPSHSSEIVEVWRTMEGVAQTIEKIHRLPHRGGQYTGWHGDIKPDNILRVHGKLKLGDFGYTKFKRAKSSGAATTRMSGGTDAYGSPEFYEAKMSGRQIPVTQKIDIWSFGCVLSVMATWIVFGARGIEPYEEARKAACQERGIDAFHYDGKVIKEVKKQHDDLRRDVRRCDVMTHAFLNLIENKMLKEEPSCRLDSTELCKEIELIFEDAKLQVNAEESLDETKNPRIQPILEKHLSRPSDHAADVSDTPHQAQMSTLQVLKNPEVSKRVEQVRSSSSNPPGSISEGIERRRTRSSESVLAANINQATELNEDNQTPIMVATISNQLDQVRLLLDNSDLSHQDNHGLTVLHYAVMLPGEEQSREIIDAILAKLGPHSDIVNTIDRNGESPLYYCIYRHLSQIARSLLEHNAQFTPKNGKDVVPAAVESGDLELVKLFFEKGAKLGEEDLPKNMSPRMRSKLKQETISKTAGRESHSTKRGPLGGFFKKRMN